MVKYMQNNINGRTSTKKRKIALALGSGGAKGLAHIGVLKAFDEAGIKFDIVTGCSMGAIIGACFALGITTEQMEQKALKLSNGDILDLKFPNTYGFVKGDKAEKVIREFLGAENREWQFSDCKVPFGCVASDIETGELVQLTSGNLIPSIRASFSIPGVFRPVTMDGRKLLDGGMLSRVPVDLARTLGADVVIAVDCIGETKPVSTDEFKYIDTIARIFNIMDYQISKHEIKRADYLLSLDQPTVSTMRIKNIADGIMVGYDTVKANLIEIKKIIKGYKR